MSAELQSTITANELSTLLIPVNGKQLVLPNVTVAEIIPYRQPEAEDDVPNWYLGSFNWRNVNVPLVSFEAINEEPFVSQSRGRRIAVFNGLVDGEKLPFYGLVTEGVPRLMRIAPDEIATDDEAEAGPSELSRVLVSGERAAIPDVDFIQQQIIEIL